MSRLALVLKPHPINYILICANDNLRSYVHVRTRYPCHPCPASVIVEFTCKRDNYCVYSVCKYLLLASANARSAQFEIDSTRQRRVRAII